VEEEGRELVSMEYIDGTTLTETLGTRGPLELQEAREVASQFLSGLEAIHQAGLVHRDFKPENVMLTRAGRVVVMDFGLAKGLGEAKTGSISGTPAYMAPEQARGDVLDARADVWAAGVVLAEMLTVGGPDGLVARRDLWKGVRETPPRVPEGPWAAVLKQALDPEPEARPASARALARALDEVTLRLPGFEEKRPYPGLASFTEEDAEYFFGREAEVEGVWKKLKRPRLLALIGPSGTGKSSFVRAGLLATLPPGWAAVVATPGHRPQQSLAQALAPSLAGDAQAVQSLLRFEETDTAVDLVSRWRRRHEHALVVVDQFEELFTLSPPETQSSFSELLSRLVLDADVHVLVSMRDDFLFHCHDHEGLAPILSELTLLGSLSNSGLRRALIQPALACGYRFEDEALVEEMVEEAGRERGALPLLAFAASRLWEKRDREQGLLTREAYQEIGGVAGALAQHAEATLERIGTPRTPLVRELFRNLVTAQGTRAMRERGELLSVFPEEHRADAEEILSALVDARLLTSFEKEGEEAGESHQEIEIIHESLLSRWPRLVRWQTQDADGAQLRDQLRQAAQAWEDRGRPEDLLWSGTAYRDFAVWKERYSGGLSTTEEAFATAAERRAGRRRRRRRWAAAAVVTVAAVVATTTSVLWRQADAEARRAEAGKLLALGERQLEEDPTEALAYATASLGLADTLEARVLATRSLWTAPPARELPLGSGSGGGPRRAAFSPDGRWVAFYGPETPVQIWGEDGSGPVELVGYEYELGQDVASVSRAGWTSSGLLVTGVAVGPRADVWSLPEGRRVRRIEFGGPSWWEVRRDRLMVEEYGEDPRPGSKDGVLLRSWALPEGEAETLGRVWVPAEAEGSTFAPDGSVWLYDIGPEVYFHPLPDEGRGARRFDRHEADISGWLVFGDQLHIQDRSGETRVWTFPLEGEPSKRLLPRPEGAPAGLRSVDLGGRWLSTIASRGDNQVRLWDLSVQPGTRLLPLKRNTSWFLATLTMSPAGDWIAMSLGQGSRLTFWPVPETLPIVTDYSPVLPVLAFSPDGCWLAAAWPEGGQIKGQARAIRLWPLPGCSDREIRTIEGIEGRWRGITFEPRGRYLAAAGDIVPVGKGRVYVVPLDGGPPRRLPGFSEGGFVGVAVSPSGRRVASAWGWGPGERTLHVWDVETGESRRLELPPPAGPAGENWGVQSLSFVGESVLLTAGAEGLRRWELETGDSELIVESEGDAVAGMAASTDGRTVVLLVDYMGMMTGQCQPVHLVRPFDGATRALAEFGDCVGSMALDPSGTVAATGGTEGILRVGRVDGGDPHLLFGHEGAIRYVAISPDRRWVASAGEDGTLRIWPMPDLDRPPIHTLPHDELMATLRSLTNIRVVRDPESPRGWKVELDRFPGWADTPEW
jgi:WD40 repeat protein